MDVNIVFLNYLLIIHKLCGSVTPTPTDGLLDDISGIKISVECIVGVMDKWNAMYINQIEPRIVSSTNTIAGLDSNIRNLQERAHVWDTFQLHVLAWNDQLATMDRKLDIMSKGQEKLFNLDGKINFISNMEYKLEAIFKKLEQTEEILSTLSNKMEHQHQGDNLFGEFATRGILSTLKVIEKKLDKIQLIGPNINGKHTKHHGEDAKPKPTIKCNTPPIVEELLHDVSSKVDVIFDKLSDKDDEVRLNEEDDEYVDDQQVSSGDIPKDLKKNAYDRLLGKIVKRLGNPCNQTTKILESIYDKITVIDNKISLLTINSSEDISKREIDNLIKIFNHNLINLTILEERRETSLSSYFTEQKRHLDHILNMNLETKCYNDFDKTNLTLAKQKISPSNIIPNHTETNASSCDSLGNTDSGVYVFLGLSYTNEENSDLYSARYCEVRPDYTWTIIQRRDDFPNLLNFTLPWTNYKYGFGQLDADFWFGNEFIHRLTSENDLILRIELEDFEKNRAWAEYDHFKVASEEENYQLFVGGYRGNASDSLSSHNYSLFSTYDRKNDNAPDCCPCALSYGGGWWFNSCYEANLNGFYYRNTQARERFRGIIWEHWLGDYSLKKSTMMVRLKTVEDLENFASVFTEKSPEDTTIISYIEDP